VGRVKVSFDLADLRGYAYYSGMRFGIYTPGPATRWCAAAATTRSAPCSAATARRRLQPGREGTGGRLPKRPLKAAIRAPWGEGRRPARRHRPLRAGGETVVCVLPGHEHEVDEFHCDRELVAPSPPAAGPCAGSDPFLFRRFKLS
jgi:ATP phosphoribosyltransferase regulatory subunit